MVEAEMKADTPRQYGHVDLLLDVTWTLVIITFASLGLCSDAKGQTSLNPTVARHQLTAGDPLRNWSALWSIDGIGDLSTDRIRLVGQSPSDCETFYPGWQPDRWEWNLHGAFRIPDNCEPGTYRVQIGSTVTNATVTVSKLPRPGVRTWISPSRYPEDDAARIEAALMVGDVDLAPGEYRLSRPIRPPAGRTIRGYGATLRRTPGVPGYRWHMIQAVDGLTFQGVTFAGIDYVFANDASGENIVLSECEIRDCQLGHWRQTGLLVDRCRFVRGSAGSVQSGTFVGCRWEGLCKQFHAFTPLRAERLALLDATFDGCDRGPGFTPNWGPAVEPLFAGVEVRGLGKVVNGNEVIGGEGLFPIERGLLLRLHSYGNCGPANFWTVPMRDSLLRGWTLDGSPLWLAGLGEQRGNRIEDVEIIGAGVYCGARATNNIFTRVHSTNWRPSKLNQVDGARSRYDLVGRAVFEADGPGAGTNRFLDSTVTGAPVPASRGVTGP